MKRFCLLTAATFLVPMVFALPVVSNVSFSEADDGEVTVTYDLAGAPAIVTADFQTNGVSIGAAHFTTLFGDVNQKIAADGTHTFKWLPYRDWDGGKIDASVCRASVTAWPETNPPEMIVVSLYSNAAVKVKYYPSADALPGGILSNILYRTCQMPLKKCAVKGRTYMIGAGKSMGELNSANKMGRRAVTFQEDFWLGVFDLTQGQMNAARYDTGSSRFNVQYFEIRPNTYMGTAWVREAANFGSSRNNAYRYPHSPNATSLCGRLLALTGLYFDLPTEAQHQTAALAGHEYGWCGAGSVTNNVRDLTAEKIGRNKYNGGNVCTDGVYSEPPDTCGPELGTAICGSYPPNDWGFYDMIGNLNDVTLDEMDWYCKGDYSANRVEPFINTTRWPVGSEDENNRANICMGNMSWKGSCNCGPADFGCGGVDSNNKHNGARLMYRVNQKSKYSDLN